MYGPFAPAAIIALIASFVFLVRWALARRQLSADAGLEFEERSIDKQATIKGVSKPAFVKLYVSAHEPRWALYAAAALVSAILMTPVAAIGLVQLWPLIVMTLDGGPWYDVGYYPWMFYMFFGMCAVWAICAAVCARILHARAPEPYQAALARARGEPLENVKIPHKRPEWAKKARPSWAPNLKPEDDDPPSARGAE
jgi:hypothetical protein